MTHSGLACLVLLLLTALPLSAQTGAATPNAHPLDPMTWQEHWTVLEVLRDNGHLDADTRFSMVNLREEPKESVLDWKPGQASGRHAFALVRQEARSFEAVIDLQARKMVSWNELEGVQPNWLGEEFESVSDMVREDPGFIAAMKLRGIDDLSFVDCGVTPPGYFGTEEQQGRRVGQFDCRLASGVRNTWIRNIEGLVVVVDMQEKKILRIVDEGVVPIPPGSADFDRDSIGQPREVPGPILVSQPMGPGFTLKGHQVEWQKWRFHVRPDHRVGMILSTVSYQDGDEQRPVMYQGSLSEIFVPYMDPSFSWYARNFLDAGEYTAGGLTKPMVKGMDCPDHAWYMDAIIADDLGRPEARSDMICIFERQPGNPSWRHVAEGYEGGPAGRVQRELVVRSAAVLGNYDYVFDWIFQQNGSIQVAAGATGIAEAKAVVQKNADEAVAKGAEAADAYGRFVDEHVVAVNHDHYFSYRIDLDVDGPTNSFMQDRLVTKMLPEGHPRRSVWVAEMVMAKKESQAMMNIDLSRPVMWRVTSAERKNHVGYPTSYELHPGNNANQLMSEDDYPRLRAGFTNHHLWVTPYREDERYAAGDYPTLSKPGMGLPAWTSADRDIAQTDIVLWYTMGMHHMVRAEDWPVMPVLWHSFEIRPFDFFDRNPALDLPE
jgi:primary-amine oxidase